MSRTDNDLTDENLIKEFISGNEVAFQTLYKKYLPKLVRRVEMYFTGHDVDDIVSEIFLGIIKNVKGFDPSIASFSTYIFSLTNNKIADQLRKKYKDNVLVELDLIVTNKQEKKQSYEMNLDKGISEEEQILLIKEEIKKLTPSERTLFSGYYFEGKTMEEIAEELGLTTIKVRVTIHRIRKKVSKQLNIS